MDLFNESIAASNDDCARGIGLLYPIMEDSNASNVYWRTTQRLDRRSLEPGATIPTPPGARAIAPVRG